MAFGAIYPAQIQDSTSKVIWGGSIQYTDSTNQPSPSTPPITSGALPTQAIVSGTAVQLSTSRQATGYSVFTADATNNVATCAVALSPDNTTFTTVATLSLAAAVNNTGAVALPITVVVPQGWYVKYTAVHGTAGTVTFA